MASEPFPDFRRGTWRMKYRPDPNGPWVAVTLGKDSRLKNSRPPKSPPEDLEARAAEFADIEYRAKHGLTLARTQPKLLGPYAEEYMKNFASIRDQGSIDLLNRYLPEFVAWCKARNLLTLPSVTDARCREFLDSIQKTRSGNTRKTVRGYISGMFTRAFQDNLIPVNPWTKARVAGNTKPKKIARFWTDAEVARIVAACYQERHRELILVMVNTGIRISAVLAMEWGWIDWEENKIVVPADQNKGNIEYDVHMSDLVHDILARRLAASKSKYVFVSKKGTPYTYSGGSAPIERAIERAKVRHGSSHDLRHTFGRSLHLAGVPQSVISKMLGHASIATTEIYTKISREDAMKFMRRLSIGKVPAAKEQPETGPRRATESS